MPKAKTRKAALKRFKITKTGKIIRGHQYARHLRTKKTKSRQRRQAEPVELTGKPAKTIRRMLPYFRKK